MSSYMANSGKLKKRKNTLKLILHNEKVSSLMLYMLSVII
jgi:hypothetical protein